MQVNQRLYLFQSSGLQCSSLHLLFNALVINELTYPLPAYAGQLTVDDKNRINAISRKVMRRGLTLTAFDIDTLIDKSDRARQLYKNISMLFLLTVKDGKLSTGVIAIFNASCYG